METLSRSSCMERTTKLQLMMESNLVNYFWMVYIGKWKIDVYVKIPHLFPAFKYLQTLRTIHYYSKLSATIALGGLTPPDILFTVYALCYLPRMSQLFHLYINSPGHLFSPVFLNAFSLYPVYSHVSFFAIFRIHYLQFFIDKAPQTWHPPHLFILGRGSFMLFERTLNMNIDWRWPAAQPISAGSTNRMSQISIF